jgi:hypothetical protein
MSTLKADAVTAVTSNTNLTLSGAGTGKVDVSADLSVGDDLTLGSDSAVFNFGADSDISFTHAADTSLSLGGAGSTTGLIINNTAGDGDPFLAFALSGTAKFTMGVDDGASDVFKIGTTAIGTGTIMTITGDDVAFADNVSLTSDSAVLAFGSDSEITITHVADTGLTLKHTATADDKPINLTLQTGETDMAANDIIGAISFQAPDEGTGTDAILVSAAIKAFAEGDHSSSSNATTLGFYTGASEAAAIKMSVTSGGDVKVLTDGASIFFGADSEIELRHVADDGLILKHVGTGDGKEPSLTFQAGDNDIAADDVLGSINFQAPDEGAGTDAILVAAGIEAVSEGDFSSSSNATKLSFKTASSAAAAETASLSSVGLFNTTGGLAVDGQKMQSFLLMFQNRSNAINHQIVSDQNTYGATDYADKINGASNSFSVTPTVDGSTAFTAGVGLIAAAQPIFDTAAMVDDKVFVGASIEYNNTGNEYMARIGTSSADVNGTTRRRLDLQMFDFDGGANVSINTTNIALNKILTIRITAFIP